MLRSGVLFWLGLGSMITKLRYLLGVSRWWRWAVVVFVALVGGLMEAVGAAFVLLLLRMVTDPVSGLVIPVFGDLRGFAPSLEDRTLILWATAGIGIFFLVRAMFRIAQTYVEQRVVHHAGLRVADTLVRGYLEMPYAWHLRRNSAELIRNAHQAVNQLVSQVFVQVVNVAAGLLLLVTLLVVLVLASPLATALAVGVIGPTVYVLMRAVQPRLKRLGRTSLDAIRRYFTTLQEAFGGIRDAKVYGRTSYFARRFRSDRAAYARAAYLQGTVAQLPRTLMELSLLLFVLVFFAVTFGTGESTASTLPVLGLFAYAGLRLQPALQRIVNGVNYVRYASAAIDEVYAGLEEIGGTPGTVPDRFERSLKFEDAVVFEDVWFRYEGSEAWALREIGLAIEHGQAVGICGPTGGGKTTLVDLFVGLLEPTRGRIRIDGRDLRGNVERWQRNLGLVSQTVFLLDDTLRRNVAFGIPDEEIDEEMVDEAIKQAQLAEFVESLPRGLDTRVGERGTRLSGGQRQRVAIARALYHRPSVLVFDEGTSALDNITEAELIKTIERLSGDRTIVTVAHRLSTLQGADVVVVVEDGQITGRGTFGELKRTHAFFAEDMS